MLKESHQKTDRMYYRSVCLNVAMYVLLAIRKAVCKII